MYMGGGRTTRLLYENITLKLYSQNGLRFLWCVRDGRRHGQTEADCYIDRYPLLLLTTARCIIFRTQLRTSSASRPGILNRRPLKGVNHSGAFSLTASWLWVWPSRLPSDSLTAGIGIYYFITPSYFRLDNMIFFRLFKQVRFWSTARLKVNM